MYAPPPPAQREQLLDEIVRDFAQDVAVVGIFVAGSLADGTADAHSDIDLRVVVTPSAIAEFCSKRLERPRRWTGFLFNEWGEDHTCCVSHFEQFAKVDVFYIAADQLKAWLRPAAHIRVVHDPTDLLTVAQQDVFTAAVEPTNCKAVEQLVGKATAYAIEVARRVARGELMYAQSMLEGLRNRLVVLEDLLERRRPGVDCPAHLEKRVSSQLRNSLYDACVAANPAALQAALAELARACSAIVSKLHERSLLTSSPAPFLRVLDQLMAAGDA
jgi:predicted nucleotidyltransferase